MPLKDMKSQYGPTNENGKPTTGTTVDTFAYENGEGLQNAASKYGPSTPRGKTPTKYGDTYEG